MLKKSVLNTRLESEVKAQEECHLPRGEGRRVSPRRDWIQTSQSKDCVGLWHWHVNVKGGKL